MPAPPPDLVALVTAAAARRGWPDASAPTKLAPGLRAVSDAYNGARFPVRWTDPMRAARLAFFVPRDVEKVATALRDVALPADARVLDLGAGMGASAIGAALALSRATDAPSTPTLTLVDDDRAALAVAAELVAAATGRAPTVYAGDVRRLPPGDRYDLVVLANVLTELWRGAPDRVDRLAALLAGLVHDRLAPGGKLLVVEPALRAEARALQEVRGALLATGTAAVLAPCTHAGACPLLADARDWCHDDRAVDLPPALVPVARAAGLRWQGLTYARLVLAAPAAPGEGRAEADELVPVRVVAPPADHRGRSERLLCGPWPDGPGARRVDRLDRDATPANAAWTEVERGDLLLLPDVARVKPETEVRKARGLTSPGSAGRTGAPAYSPSSRR